VPGNKALRRVESEDDEMNKCLRCGQDNVEDANFCSRCGARLGAAAGIPGDNTGVIPVMTEDVVTETPALSGEALSAIENLAEGNGLLVVQRGPNVGTQFLLDQDVTTAGRSTHSDIFLDDITVSRHHVKFLKKDGRIFVEDQGSLNGTYVNRTLVDGSAPLREGDEVQIGKFRMIFHAGGSGLR